MPDKQDKLDKFQKILKEALDRAKSDIDPEDVKKIFQVMLQMKQGLMADAQKLKEAHDSVMAMLESKVQNGMSEAETKMLDTAKKEMEKMINPMMAEHEEMMGECEEKMGEMDEKMEAHEKEMYVKMEEVAKMIDEIPKPEPLQPVEEKLRLLEDMLKGLEQRTAEAFSTHPVGGLISSRMISPTILTTASTIDANNLQFVFDKEPKIVVVNGTSYRKTKGWSWSGHTATLDNPVGVGGDIYAIF